MYSLSQRPIEVDILPIVCKCVCACGYVCVFVSFHHLFHRKTDANKPRTVSSKRDLSQKRRAVSKIKNCLKYCFTKTRTGLKNCFIKTRAVLKKRELSRKYENCFKNRELPLKRFVGTVSKKSCGNCLRPCRGNCFYKMW